MSPKKKLKKDPPKTIQIKIAVKKDDDEDNDDNDDDDDDDVIKIMKEGDIEEDDDDDDSKHKEDIEKGGETRNQIHEELNDDSQGNLRDQVNPTKVKPNEGNEAKGEQGRVEGNEIDKDRGETTTEEQKDRIRGFGKTPSKPIKLTQGRLQQIPKFRSKGRVQPKLIL